MYGTQPYYTCLEADGNTHSVALMNSNAQGKLKSLIKNMTFSKKIESIPNFVSTEFTFKQGSVIQYTTIGGLFDLYFFLGPNPEDTVQQYSQVSIKKTFF